MREKDAKDPTLGQLIESKLNAGEDVQAVARRALAFLLACVDGEITDATVGDRIAAARSASTPPGSLTRSPTSPVSSVKEMRSRP